MTDKTVRKTTRKGGGRKRAAKTAATAARASTVASELPKPDEAQVERAKRRFADGLIARGEAVPAGKPLPPGATHEVRGRDARGGPVVKRRRFSLK